MIRRPPRSTRTDTLFPYTTLVRSKEQEKSCLRIILVPYNSLTSPRILPHFCLLTPCHTCNNPHHTPLLPIKCSLFLSPCHCCAIIQLSLHVIADSTPSSEESLVGKECVSTCRYGW